MGAITIGAFILVALIALILATATSLARPPGAGRRDAPGLLARLVCPRTGEQTAVRIGRDPVDRVPAVTWCQHFPAGRMECGRECFTSLDGVGDPIALMEPA